jgi:hypothetical protein
MVGGYFALQYLDVISQTDFPNEVSHPDGGFAIENLSSILGNPNEMRFKVIFGMARSSIVLHIIIIWMIFRIIKLKSSPEGEGFPPLPRGRH